MQKTNNKQMETNTMGWFIDLWKKEWPIMKSAPFSFLICLVVGIFVGLMSIHLLYAHFVIPGKDSTINSKDTIINSKDLTISSLQQERDSLKAKLQEQDNSKAKSQAGQIQWYLKIKRTDYVTDKDGNPIDTPFRVTPIINGQKYSYPVDSIYTKGGITKEESFPIPINIKPPYQIKFEGILLREGKTQIPMRGKSEDTYQIHQLPSGEHSCEIIVNDSPILHSDGARVTIYYEIMNYQEENK
jgi:hypothetical protein